MANTFRATYRELSDDEKAVLAGIKEQAEVLEEMYKQVTPGRYPALAQTALEESVMWIVKGITQ